MRARTEKALLLLLATQIGRYSLTRSTKHVCPYKTCFVTGPSQYKFHDPQKKEEEKEKISLLI
jgi:hypothetical protein